MGLGDLPRVPRRARPPPLDGRRRHPDRPRRGAGLRHGRARGRATSPPRPTTSRPCAPSCERRCAAGALGFSTSRTIAHRAIDGEPVPGTFAAEDELFGIGAALGELGTGVFELAPAGVAGEDVDRPGQGGRLDAPPVGGHRPPGHLRPAPGRRRARPVARAHGRVAARRATRGPQLWPQVGGARHRPADRPPHHVLPVRLHPRLPGAQGPQPHRRAVGPGPAATRRCATPSCRSSPSPTTAPRWSRPTRVNFVLGTPPDYEPGPERSLAAIAAAAGRHPLEVAYDVMLEADGQGCCTSPSSTTPR